MSTPDVAFRLPDLGFTTAVRVSLWLVEPGQDFLEDDSLVEVVATDVAVGISAPFNGRLVRYCLLEDDVVESGQVLAWLRPEDPSLDD